MVKFSDLVLTHVVNLWHEEHIYTVSHCYLPVGL